jgi:hypothetical protein
LAAFEAWFAAKQIPLAQEAEKERKKLRDLSTELHQTDAFGQ